MKREEFYNKFWEALLDYCSDSEQSIEESYDKTANLIRKMDLRTILLGGSTVTIELGRPGIIIGKYGKLIEHLKDYIGLDIKIYEAEELKLEDKIIQFYFDYDDLCI